MQALDRAELGRFARRLRQSRRALGLSQEELAGGVLSASYVSLLEAGKRSPTSEVLALLADRLQCSVSYLIEGVDPAEHEKARLTLEYAELALRNGEAPDALVQLEALLHAASGLGAEHLWRARRLHARALEGTGRLEQALAEFEALKTDAAADKRFAEELQLAVDLVRCYQEVGDVSLAIDLGQSTLERLAALELAGTDDHARLVSALIGAYYERGDVRRAAMLAEATISQMDAIGSRHARAAVYWNASLTREATGDTAGALILAERAVALLGELDEARSLGRLRTALGWLLLRLDPPDPERALYELGAALQGLLDTGSQVDLAYCETELGRCELIRGEPEKALDHTQAARNYLGPAQRVESAHAMLVEGRALLAVGHSAEALATYLAAGQLLTALGVPRQAAAAWRELGDAYLDLAMLEEATVAYRQALTDAGLRASLASAPSLLDKTRG